MNSQEMEVRYASLKQAKDKGSITDAQFRADVAQLRMQASDGSWYQIDPADGRWLKWNGRAWEKTAAPASQTRPPQQSPTRQPATPQQAAAQPEVPKKFFPLLGYIIKSTFVTFKKQLPMMIFFGVLGWLLHTYLLVVINQGFNPSTTLGNFLGTTGNSLSGSIIWMVASGLLFGWIGQKFFSKGQKPPKQPPLSTLFREAGGMALAAIVAAAGLSMVIGITVNGYANAALAVGFGGIMISQGGSVVGLLVSSAWSSTYGLAQSAKTAVFSASAGRVAMVGGIAGFLLNSFMPTWGKAIFGIVFLIGAFLLVRRQGQSFASFFMTILPVILLMSAIVILWKAVPVLADDGGSDEAPGGFVAWVQSEGATRAILMGVGPGIGTIIGPALYQTLISIGGNIQLPPGSVVIPPGTGPVTGPGEDTITVDESGNPIVKWEPGKFGPDQDGNPGKPGLVWHWGKWVTPQQAREEVAQDLERQRQDQVQYEKNIADFRASNARQLAKDRAEGQRQINEANARRAQEAAQKAYNERLQAHIVSKLKDDPSVSGQLSDMDLDGLKDIYRDKLHVQIDTGIKDAAYYNNVATAYGVAETAARVTVAVTKGALVTIGGPAGIAVTATAMGTISAAEQGSESYVRGDSAGEILTHTAVGFVSGAKDGAIGVYTNMPGVSKLVKYVVPAAADTAQTYIQLNMDNPNHLSQAELMEKSLASGGLSLATTFVGSKIDGIPQGALHELAQATTGGVAGGVSSVIQGGDFGEGFVSGLEGAVGGRVGGHLGTSASNYARSQTEQQVQTAITDANARKQQEIPIEQQGENVQKLVGTKYQEGGKTYVDEGGALKQLQDTSSSRTLKQAPDPVKDAVINTREDKIYGPANKATVSKAEQTLSEAGLLQPGDKIKMDSFSTPGKGNTPSVGADRDARLVIERTDPVTGEKVNVEVPRKYWENDAYKDFYEHTTKLAGGEQNITPETQPEYFKRLNDLQYLKGGPDGLTPEQIQHRAWAETHNQLFTDRSHVEASVDNSDQITKFVGGKPVQTQGESNVTSTQRGDSTLLDPEGYSKMWHEKSEIYARMGNQPEAIAQSQKGIEQYMKIRDGYHAQGYEVPPVDARTAKAMDIITNSPVGVDATPDAMANVQKQLQAIGYKDTNDALGKIATQHEVLKWSQPKPQIGAVNTTRLGIDAAQPPEEPLNPGYQQ
jgi:hypothetical protein